MNIRSNYSGHSYSRRLVMVLLCLLYLGGILRLSVSADTGSRPEVLIFYNNPCESCYEDKKLDRLVIDNLPEGVTREDLVIRIYSVISTEGADMLRKIRIEQKLERKDITYPLMVVNKTCYFGFDEIAAGIQDLAYRWEIK